MGSRAQGKELALTGRAWDIFPPEIGDSRIDSVSQGFLVWRSPNLKSTVPAIPSLHASTWMTES